MCGLHGAYGVNFTAAYLEVYTIKFTFIADGLTGTAYLSQWYKYVWCHNHGIMWLIYMSYK